MPSHLWCCLQRENLCDPLHSLRPELFIQKMTIGTQGQKPWKVRFLHWSQFSGPLQNITLLRGIVDVVLLVVLINVHWSYARVVNLQEQR